MSEILLHERYEIVREIGKGGTSHVFQVLDHRLSLPFAMKRMAKSGDQKEAFDEEIQLMAQLHHAGIPRIMDCFEDAHFVYAIMELIEGVSLLHFVSHSVIKQSLILEWMEQICAIFLYLHSRVPKPLLYLDLKPQNMMIDNKGRLYLIDFGSSCWSDEIRVHSATPGYAPKELLEEHAPCFQSDIYSFGRTFYVLYHGCFPDGKKRGDSLDNLLFHCCEEEVSKRYVNFELVRRAMVKLRVHQTHYTYFLGISMFLCLVFLFLGMYSLSAFLHHQEETYATLMRQHNYQEAIAWKSEEVEPYQKFYEESCDIHDSTSCEAALRQLEGYAFHYHQEGNEKIALFLAIEFMMQDERSDYERAQYYFEQCQSKGQHLQKLVTILEELAKLLQKQELTKQDGKQLASHLKQLEKNNEQLIDQEEVLQYQKLCMHLYERYHKELPDSENRLIEISKEMLSLMSKSPNKYTWKERMQVEEVQARGYYYLGLTYYEEGRYETMVEAYDEAIKVMKDTEAVHKYAMLTDMELACFTYGVKEEEKNAHLNRLQTASSYAEKIEDQEEREYYQNKIEGEWNLWKN